MIVATGFVRPSNLSVEYKVRLVYKDGEQPRVRVTNPPLRQREDGVNIPHMYDQKRICVFHPRYGEWTRADFLADTVVQWISEWLLFYEYWLATGDWFGGGEHPPAGRSKQSEAAGIEV